MKLYNVYDKDNNLVFVGNINECSKFLNTSPRGLKSAIESLFAFKHLYYVIPRDDMIDYEKHRGNEKGYKRV